MPSMPSSARASFTSSSLKGLMIASSFFIAGKLACPRPFANRKRIAARALLATRHARCNYDFARIKEMSSGGAMAAKGARDWSSDHPMGLCDQWPSERSLACAPDDESWRGAREIAMKRWVNLRKILFAEY